MNAKKILAMCLAAVMLVAASVAGTLAYLKAETNVVTNTFSPSNISIELKESPLVTGTNADGRTVDKKAANDTDWVSRVTEENNYQMVPGFTLQKDPAVMVAANSEACYVFVKVAEVNNGTAAKPYLTYTVDSTKWEEVTTAAGTGYKVYAYKEVVAKSANNQYLVNIFANDQVSVNSELTSADMTAAENAKPQLVLTAYATQAYSTNDTLFETAAAWANVAPVEEPSADDSAN